VGQGERWSNLQARVPHIGDAWKFSAQEECRRRRAWLLPDHDIDRIGLAQLVRLQP